MQQLLKVDSVMYKVADLDSATKFYADNLGLKQVWKDEEAKMIGLRLAQSDSEIVLHSEPQLPDFDYSYLVNGVRKLVTDWKRKGYSVDLEPAEVRSGYYAIVKDPDGNKIPIIDLSKFGGKPKYD